MQRARHLIVFSSPSPRQSHDAKTLGLRGDWTGGEWRGKTRERAHRVTKVVWYARARARARHTHICNGQAFVKWNLKFLTQAFRVRNLRDEKRRETFDEIRRSIFLAQIRANSIVSRWGRAIGMSNGDAKTEIERHTAILYSQRFYPECVA